MSDPASVDTAAAEHVDSDLDWALLSETAGARYGFRKPSVRIQV